jgi:glucokinase
MGVNRSAAVGIEVASGQATVALIDHHGRILHRANAKTLQGRSAMATLEPYLRTVDAVLARARSERLSVRGIGISIPGSLDESLRRPQLISLLPSLNGFPLCELLEARYHLPTHLHVDVDASLLAEHRFGSGRGFRRLILLKVQAVVGAALVVDGQPERSTLQSIGHVAHLSVAPTTTGPRCSCGKRGCINTLISLDAMLKMVQRALRRGDESNLTRRLLNRESFSPQLLAEEAGRGDALALRIYSEVGRWLSAAVSHYLDLFEPQMLILAGDILCTGEFLLTQVRRSLATSSRARVCSTIEVVPACLGRDATLLGSVAPLFT